LSPNNKRDGSPFWWCGFHHKGIYHRSSTKEAHRPSAEAIAGDWYLEQLVAIRGGAIPGPKTKKPTMADAAKSAMIEFNALVAKGERSPSYLKSLRNIMYNTVLPYFADVPVDEVDNAKWHQFKREINERKPNTSFKTFHQYRNALSAMLNAALNEGWIDTLPSLKDHSSSNKNTKPRVWFKPSEVQKLRRALVENIELLKKTRHREHAEELRDYVEFLLFTGLRVGEAQNVRFCDVEVRANRENRLYLLISNIKGKARTGSCKSDVEAHVVFGRITDRVKPKPNKEQSEQRLFLRHHRDGFKAVLDRIGLRTDAFGRRRDFVSLRHTYISNKILMGVPSNTIANNCRTSTVMIDSHYAKWLEPELNPILHRKLDLVDDAITGTTLDLLFED
jgi:integrase